LERSHRRNFILDVAARVFGRKPFDEASMQEVAAEAEIGMQGLYEHFPSKQELYEEVILHRAREFQARADEIYASPGTPLDQLRRLGLAYVAQFKEQPWHLPTFVRNRAYFDWGVDSRFSPRLAEIYSMERGNVKGLIEGCVAMGALQPLDPEFLTQLCIDVLQSSLHFSRNARPEESAEECVERALGCLFDGVGTRR
jgi:TetR/AcrR family transcriptional regulator